MALAPLSKDELIDPFKIIDYEDLKNGNIIYLYLYHNRKVLPLVNEVKTIPSLQHLPKKNIRASLMCLIKSYTRIIANYTRNFTRLTEFLNKSYQPPSRRQTTCQQSKPIDSTPAQALPPNPTPVLRKDCKSCFHRRQTYANLQKRVHHFKIRVGEKSEKIKDIISKYNVKYVNKYRKRKGTQLDRLKEKIKLLEKENKRLQRLVAKLNHKVDQVKKLGRSLNDCKKSAMKSSTAVKELKSQIKIYSNTDRAESECDATITEVTKGKSFDLPIRLCLYKCLVSNVSTESAGPLISFIHHQLTGNSISSIPSPPTVSHLSYELAVLSSIQAAEFIINAESSVTLSWDATTFSGTGSHINEVNVSRKGPLDKIESIVLQVDQLSGGTARDYSSHIVQTLKDVSSIYSKYLSICYEEVFCLLTKKIKSYLTDRCAVNDATARLLKDTFQSELLALKCLIHPLDTIASAARTCLKQKEATYGLASKSFGTECAAANVLRALTTLRFKAGVGDPQGMTIYFKDHNVPMGLVVRYVGNRLHVLFHMAFVVYIHRDLFLDFVNPKNGRDSALKRALFCDLTNEVIIMEFQALALMGKVITGPWMSVFYCDREHMEAVPKLQKSHSILQDLQLNPKLYFTTTKDVFGNDIEDKKGLEQLRAKIMNPIELEEVLGELTKTVLNVFERQMGQYIGFGKLAEPSANVLCQASGAPLHNMSAERALGTADNIWRRAPNANIGFINGKTIARSNSTISWLSSKSELEKMKLLKFCIPTGYSYQKQIKERAGLMSTKISNRHFEAKKKKEKMERRLLEKSVKEAMVRRSLQSVGNLDSTFDLDISKARDFILNPSRLNGIVFTHVWEDNEEASLWNGRVHVVKQRKDSSVVVVGYWALDQDESSSEDYDIKVESLLADMIVGDVTICEE